MIKVNDISISNAFLVYEYVYKVSEQSVQQILRNRERKKRKKEKKKKKKKKKKKNNTEFKKNKGIQDVILNTNN